MASMADPVGPEVRRAVLRLAATPAYYNMPARHNGDLKRVAMEPAPCRKGDPARHATGENNSRAW